MLLFADIGSALGLLLLPVAFWAWWRGERVRATHAKAWGTAPSIASGGQARERGPVSPTKRYLRAVAIAVFLLFAVAALVRPRAVGETVMFKREGVDVVFVVDTSRSMLAADIAPNRLERVKLEIAHLTEQLKGNRVALVSFAGDAFVYCPLTTDMAAVRTFLKGMRAGEIGQGGTNIGRALAVAQDLLESGQARPHARAVILMTDGEDNEPQDFDKALARVVEGRTVVHTVGVGSASGEPIPSPTQPGGYLVDKQGKPVISRRDDATLSRIAKDSGGVFSDLGHGTELKEILAALSRMRKEAFEAGSHTHFDEYFVWPLGLAIAALLFSLLLDDRRGFGLGSWRWGRNPSNGAKDPDEGRTSAQSADHRFGGVQAGLGAWVPGVVLVSVGAVSVGCADPFRSEDPHVAQGNAHYAAARFSDAVGAYDRADKTYAPAPGEAPRSQSDEDREAQALIAFNRGTALLAQREFDKAGEEFVKALAAHGDKLRSLAHYNMGTALILGLLDAAQVEYSQAKRRLEQAQDALKRALKLRPSFEDARYNLEFAIALAEQLEEQRKAEKEKNKDKPPPEGEKKDENAADDPEEGEDESEGEKQAGEDGDKKDDQQQAGQDGDKKNGDKKDDQQQAGQDGDKKDSQQQQAGQDGDKKDSQQQQAGQDGDKKDGDKKNGTAAQAAEEGEEGGEGEDAEAKAVKLSRDQARQLLDALRESEQPFRIVPFQTGSGGANQTGAGGSGKDW